MRSGLSWVAVLCFFCFALKASNLHHSWESWSFMRQHAFLPGSNGLRFFRVLVSTVVQNQRASLGGRRREFKLQFCLVKVCPGPWHWKQGSYYSSPALSIKLENALGPNGEYCCTGNCGVPRLPGAENTAAVEVVSLSSRFIKPVRRLTHAALSSRMHPPQKGEIQYGSQWLFQLGGKIRHSRNEAGDAFLKCDFQHLWRDIWRQKT